jgi:hypothetical protein
MVEYVELEQAQKSGAAYLVVTGNQATDGTLRYYSRVQQVTPGQGTTEPMRGKNRTLEELRDGAQKLANKRGVAFIVEQLPQLVLASVTVPAP